MLQVRPFTVADTESIVALWKFCDLTRPWNDPRRDIARKLQVQPELFLTGLIDGSIVGTVMAGYDGHRGWINYLAVHPEHRRQGLGRRLMAEAESRLRQLGCPKINLQVRAQNREAVAFYQRLGISQDDVLSFGLRLERDGPRQN